MGDKRSYFEQRWINRLLIRKIITLKIVKNAANKSLYRNKNNYFFLLMNNKESIFSFFFLNDIRI